MCQGDCKEEPKLGEEMDCIIAEEEYSLWLEQQKEKTESDLEAS
jgi:hypothetical protein